MRRDREKGGDRDAYDRTSGQILEPVEGAHSRPYVARSAPVRAAFADPAPGRTLGVKVRELAEPHRSQ